MAKTFFVTGIGTDVGKTVAAAIVTEALQADYWKPVQAGFDSGTDQQTVADLVSNTQTVFHAETYKLAMPASPHIAAREEGVIIDLERVVDHYRQIKNERTLVIEGAGGLLVPLNGHQFVADLIKTLNAEVLLVSRNYLGSINHSLLTAAYCKQQGLQVAGWIFNDQYLQYEQEIADWSGYPVLGGIPFTEKIDKTFISHQAAQMRLSLLPLL